MVNSSQPHVPAETDKSADIAMDKNQAYESVGLCNQTGRHTQGDLQGEEVIYELPATV